jgi:cation/acetate symporter
MSATQRTRLVNPRLGTYFGIFVSAFVALLLLAVIGEQLGIPDAALRWGVLVVPLLLYAVVGVVAQTQDAADFFVAGRRVPAFFTGLGLGATALGGVGVVSVTGALMLNGIDAWCIVNGVVSGFVVCAVLIAPYLRKFGSYTLPGYLGRRFESRLVRVVAASLLSVPLLLIIIAEFKIGMAAAAWLSGASERSMATLLGVAVIATIGLGGMRSLTWSGTAAALALIIALVVPVAIVATEVTNFPLAQLSHGPTLRAVERMESARNIPIPDLSLFHFELAGTALEPLQRRMSRPFGSLGLASYIMTALTLTMGIAVAPWLIPRIGATPGVYETRKSMGWAVFTFGMLALTASAIAVFQREIVMSRLVGQSAAVLPEWFAALAAAGHAAVDGSLRQVPMAGFSFQRDAVLFMLPSAANLPVVLLYLTLAGAVAAAFAAICASVTALGAIIAEDGINGYRWESPPDGQRLMIVRLAMAVSVLLGASLALTLPADPLMLVLWAIGLSAAAAFPVVALSIWWKRINTLGALACMITGFIVAVLGVVAGEANMFGIPSAVAGGLAVPVGILAAIIGTKFGPAPNRQSLELVRDVRVPGGETVYDREQRLLRLKRRQRPA